MYQVIRNQDGNAGLSGFRARGSPSAPLAISAEDAPCRQLLTQEDTHGDSGHKMIQGPRAQSP